MWALLPLIASRQLGLDADGYGLLFAALGLGAVVGALGLGRVKQHLSSNAVLGLAAAAFALAFGSLVLVPNPWLALPLLVVCGFGWTATVSTIISELQLFLPGWVRARAIAIYLMVFLGSQAVAAPIWGLVTQHLGLQVAILAAAVLVGLSAVAGWCSRCPESQDLDRAPLAYWGAAPVALEPEPDAGPIVVSIEYEVAADQRGRLPARPWRRCAAPGCAAEPPAGICTGSARARTSSVEQFQVPTWREHQRQHDGRLTADDQAIEDAAFAHIVGTPTGPTPAPFGDAAELRRLTDSSALFILWEDLWAAELGDAVRSAGGELVAGGRIPHRVVEQIVGDVNVESEGAPA